jgi:hypothetical protein
VFHNKLAGHQKSINALAEIQTVGQNAQHFVWSGDTQGIIRIWDADV